MEYFEKLAKSGIAKNKTKQKKMKVKFLEPPNRSLQPQRKQQIITREKKCETNDDVKL